MMFFALALTLAQGASTPIDTNVIFASLGGLATLITVLISLVVNVRTRKAVSGDHAEALREIRVNVNGTTEKLLRQVGELTQYNAKLIEALARSGAVIPPMGDEPA